MGLNTLIRDVQDTKDQLGPSDTESLVFKKFDQNIQLLKPVVKINKTNIGDAMVAGHPVNGVSGVANGIGGGQITAGDGDIGATSLARVFCSNNIFSEMLRDTEFIDIANSTAIVDTTNFKITF